MWCRLVGRLVVLVGWVDWCGVRWGGGCGSVRGGGRWDWLVGQPQPTSGAGDEMSVRLVGGLWIG